MLFVREIYFTYWLWFITYELFLWEFGCFFNLACCTQRHGGSDHFWAYILEESGHQMIVKLLRLSYVFIMKEVIYCAVRKVVTILFFTLNSESVTQAAIIYSSDIHFVYTFYTIWGKARKYWKHAENHCLFLNISSFEIPH